MELSTIGWNQEARDKILLDADRALQGAGVDLGARQRHDRRADVLPGHRRRDADHRGVADPAGGQQRPLDLGRVDVDPATDDEVDRAAADRQALRH